MQIHIHLRSGLHHRSFDQAAEWVHRNQGSRSQEHRLGPEQYRLDLQDRWGIQPHQRRMLAGYLGVWGIPLKVQLGRCPGPPVRASLEPAGTLQLVPVGTPPLGPAGTPQLVPVGTPLLEPVDTPHQGLEGSSLPVHGGSSLRSLPGRPHHLPLGRPRQALEGRPHRQHYQDRPRQEHQGMDTAHQLGDTQAARLFEDRLGSRSRGSQGTTFWMVRHKSKDVQ